MDKRYEVFCLADRYFYETPDRLSVAPDGSDPGLETARRPAPEGWLDSRRGDWRELCPAEDRFPGIPALPAQGWKIHVSATLAGADTVAATVWDYCVPRGIPFKFVPDRNLLHLRNAKYAARGTSGKFCTVYPADEDQLQRILKELDELLAGTPGPYILSDLRWREGPLYVRYGGFASRYCADDQGRSVPAIEDPEGRLVPDRKDPAFTVPRWVTLPGFLRPQLAARNAVTVADLPYRVERALHFSNGGGVYAGTDPRGGARVVLKEGRPYAGLAADGADAVTRLEREKNALDQLAGLDVVPAVHDWFTLGGHRFLVLDELPGQMLSSFFARRHPLLTPDTDPRAVADYTQWALTIHQAVTDAVAAVHERGIAVGDLHMFNIMVAPDEKSVALFDFEDAAPAGDDFRQTVAHPGFLAPSDRRGFDVDRYALACLRLALFLPMTSLLAIDQGKAAHLAQIAAREFPAIPPEFLHDAVAEIEGRAPASPSTAGPEPSAAPTPTGVEPADWPHSRDAMVRAILGSATSDRDDRLFPGDIAQFTDGGGLGVAHGAAGVLYALAETGAARYEPGERWLLDHTDPPPPGTPPGFYDGLLGVAHVVARLGHPQRALDLAESVLASPWQRLGHDLFSGLAGVGLALADLGARTGESALRSRALEAAELTADRLEKQPPRAGLLHGASGPALLFLRLYETTGDPGLLDLAADALHRDLRRCVPGERGALQVDEGTRTMPYLGAGSVGIAMVLDDYLAHRPGDAVLGRARTDILPVARLRYYAQPGLFQGRAGMLLHLSRTATPGVTAGDLEEQLDCLGWYAMRCPRGLSRLVFPGDQMMRLSMDLATGTAGCLLAVGVALHGEPVQLPFLPPLKRPSEPL